MRVLSTPRVRWLLLLIAALCGRAVSAQAPTPAASPEPTGLQAAIALESAMTKTIANCEKSLVSIARVAKQDNNDVGVEFLPGVPGQLRPRSNDPRDPSFVPKEFATGVVIDAKGYILTNFHVVNKDDLHLVTTINKRVFRTVIVAADPRSDLAVLKVAPNESVADDDFAPIKFGDSKSLKKGQIVIALGNPYGIARDGQVSASWGIISNLSRKLSPRNQGEEPTLHQFGTLIQTDARLNWGTSGGALINLKGEMVGLTTSLAATSGFEQAAGYAIPIDAAFLRIINTLKAGREVEYGFLGISPAESFDQLHGSRRAGLVVGHVGRGTPAAAAGLRDKAMFQAPSLITHIGGEAVNDFDDLRLQVGKLQAGARTSITFEQDGQVLVRDLVVAKYRPSAVLKSLKPIVSVRDPDWRGLRVDFASAVVGVRIGTSDALVTPVAVSEVEPNSLAAKAGLAPGMFVKSVDGTPLETPDDFRREVAKVNKAVTIKVIDFATGFFGKDVVVAAAE